MSDPTPAHDDASSTHRWFRRRPRTFDVAVIGAGMGGWAGARAARSRGKRVVLFESGPVGGT